MEYANAVLATMPLHHTFGLSNGDQPPEELHEQGFGQIRDHARVAVDYLRFFDPEATEFARLLKAGESKTVERKSTLRWNVKAERNDDAITHSCLKTIAAFLNTEDGHLLIGVADGGQITGIELDGFPNDDKFLLHLYNVIRQSLGEDAATLVDARIVTHEEKKFCILACHKSSTPVYMKYKKL